MVSMVLIYYHLVKDYCCTHICFSYLHYIKKSGQRCTV